MRSILHITKCTKTHLQKISASRAAEGTGRERRREGREREKGKE